jgi:ADP-ribose pyrophosphatase YjhB (NUDIX family)
MTELPIKIQAILYAKTEKGIEYLLIKRTPEDGGFWQPVTGGVHDGEKLLDCLAREVRKEVGLDRLEDVSEPLYWYNWQESSGQWMTDYVYAVRVPRDAEISLARDEHDDYKWCDYDGARVILGKDGNKRSLKVVNDHLTGRAHGTS